MRWRLSGGVAAAFASLIIASGCGSGGGVPSVDPTDHIEPTVAVPTDVAHSSPSPADVGEALVARLVDPDLALVAGTKVESLLASEIMYYSVGPDWASEWSQGTHERLVDGVTYIKRGDIWTRDNCLAGTWTPPTLPDVLGHVRGAEYLGSPSNATYEFELLGLDVADLWIALGVVEPWVEINRTSFSIVADADGSPTEFWIEGSWERVEAPGGDPLGTGDETWKTGWAIAAVGEAATRETAAHIAVPDVPLIEVRSNGVSIMIQEGWGPPELDDGSFSFMTGSGSGMLLRYAQTFLPTLETWEESFQESMTVEGGATLVGREDVTIAGSEGRLVKLRWTKDGEETSASTAVFVHEHDAYALVLSGDIGFGDALRADLLEIIDSLKFTD